MVARLMGLGAFSAGVLAPETNAASAYETIVAPVFETRCVACHGEKKQKGKLALHTWERITQGGDSGPLWEAGKPAESELVRRLRLPVDDEEHMPPSDEPQPSAEEIALIERWIAGGAAPEMSVADLKLSPEMAVAAAELPAKLEASGGSPAAHAEAAWELDLAAVAESRAPLAGRVADLQRRFPGALTYESRSSAALHFTAAALGQTFGDAELAELAAVGDAVASLDLSGTAVTDHSAPVLARFAQLRLLRLGFTAIGDATVASLAGLANLVVLALHESAVTAASVPVLARLNLRRLYIGNTAAAGPARDAHLPVVEAGMEMFPPIQAPVTETPPSRS